MDLLLDVITSINKYGNATVHIDNYNVSFEFLANKGDHIYIRLYKDEYSAYAVPLEDGLHLLAYLVFYSLNYDQRDQDITYVTYDQESRKKVSKVAINELYQQINNMLLIDQDYISQLANNANNSAAFYDTIVRHGKYVDIKKTYSVRTILDLLIKQHTAFSHLLNNQIDKNNIEIDIDKDTQRKNKIELQLFKNKFKAPSGNKNIEYTILNEQGFLLSPYIIDENIRILEMGILSQNKSTILIGNSGVGKTSIVEGLSYLIQHQNVSKALRNIKILKVDATCIEDTFYNSDIQEEIGTLVDYLNNNRNVILFIDSLKEFNEKGNSNNFLFDMLIPYIKKYHFKVIACVTRNNKDGKYLDDPIIFPLDKPTFIDEKEFQIFYIQEPNNLQLIEIIKTAIAKLEKVTNIKWLLDEQTTMDIINILVTTTIPRNRNIENSHNNPDLSITILENAFALAILDEKEYITVEHVIEALKNSELIIERACNEAIKKLNAKADKDLPKIIKLSPYKN